MNNTERDEGRHSSIGRQMRDGYRLATAEILYHMPDHPGLLQSYIWQDLDLAPRFPVLQRFLSFWQRELEGPLHSVRLGHCNIISPGEIAFAKGEWRLH